MNITSFSNFFERLKYRLASYARLLDMNADVSSFSTMGTDDTIQRIYVINLDRKPDRWNQVNRELMRFRGRSGLPLSSITRRFSAIDARYMAGDPDEKSLHPYYSLAEQLQVEPNPQLRIDAKSRVRRIEMSRQEIAVALSHIEVWKLIASGDVSYILLCHNHPSGDPAPSQEDLALTARFVKAGELLGIPVIDHIVIGDSDFRFFSMKQRGLI